MQIANEIVKAFPAPQAQSKQPAKKAAKRAKKAATKVLDAKLQHATAQAVKSWQSAEGKATGALLRVFVSCIEGGAVTVDMLAKYCPRISESSRPVYASRFNLAGKVAKIIGAQETGGVIERAANAPGKTWENVIAALAAVRDAAAQGGVKLATSEQRENFAAEANAAVAEKVTARKAKKSATRSQQAGTLAKAAAAAGAGHRDMATLLRNLSVQAHGRMSAPEGREQAFAEAKKALSVAAEKWAIFLG